MFPKKVLEKIKYTFCDQQLFQKIVPFEIMSENVVKQERSLMTIRRIRVTHWTSKATRSQADGRAIAPTSTRARAHTHTHTEISNTYFFSTAKIVSQTRLYEHFTYITFLVFYTNFIL
jgi:hypothetical protein